MEFTNHPLIHFLRDELSLPSASISLALQHSKHTPSLMPMVLWQYGLVSLSELNDIFDWLENCNVAR
jgi:Protein of unknown function (DUF2949)